MSYGYDTSEEMEARLEEMLELPMLDAGEGYDWNDFRAWYDADERIFYWGEAAGCSCSYFWEYFHTLADFSNGRRADLLNAADSFIFNAYTKPDEESVAKFKAAVRAIKEV